MDKQIISFLNPSSNVKKISLQTNDASQSAAIIQQTWNDTHFRRYKSNCEFHVNTLRNSTGIFAVVQNLNLRKNSKTGDCIDYVRFSFGDKFNSGKLCGEMGPKLGHFRTFEDPYGAIKVEVFTNLNEPLKFKESLELNLVFTAYSDCHPQTSTIKKPDRFQCTTFGCIDSSFDQDHIINCPIPNCLDEQGCFDIEKVKVVSTSNIAISAITSLIFTMVGVGSCIWMCWKHKECFRQCAASSHQQHSNSGNNGGMMNNSSGGRSDGGGGSGHRLPSNMEMQSSSSGHRSQDKDLPPSYDSLFPDR